MTKIGINSAVYIMLGLIAFIIFGYSLWAFYWVFVELPAGILVPIFELNDSEGPLAVVAIYLSIIVMILIVGIATGKYSIYR